MELSSGCSGELEGEWLGGGVSRMVIRRPNCPGGLRKTKLTKAWDSDRLGGAGGLDLPTVR